MSFHVLPPLPLEPLIRISPTSYFLTHLCALREIWSASYQPRLLPLSPAAYLGIVIHKMFELVNQGIIKNEESINNNWEKEIKNIQENIYNNNIEKHLVPLENSAGNYEVKRIMVFMIIRSLIQNDSQLIMKKGKHRQESEVWLETSDKKVAGKVDLIRQTDTGIELVEYKTGSVADPHSSNELPKQEYRQQLKLYAALYYSVHRVWPTRLTLVDLSQKKHNIPFDKDECLKLLKNAKAQIDDLNELIESDLSPEDFAQPSPKSCKYCTYRPACAGYWKERQNTAEWPVDAIGKVKERKILGNGLGRVVLENEGRDLAIRNLSIERYTFFNDDSQNVLFCNLGHDTSEGFFTEKILTTGYIF